MSRNRGKGVPADGKPFRADAGADAPTITKHDPRPATPRQSPPRELVHGDQLAIYIHQGGWHGTAAEGEPLDIWRPYYFDRWETLANNRVLMRLTPTDPRRSSYSLWTYSYGDPTGITPDLGTVFYRFASDIRFFYFCPTCFAEGSIYVDTIPETCPECRGVQYIERVDVFNNPPPKVRHYKASKGAMPTVAWERPGGADIVVMGRPMNFHKDGNELRVTLGGLPKVTYDRIMAEPDADRMFTLDKNGMIVE